MRAYNNHVPEESYFSCLAHHSILPFQLSSLKHSECRNCSSVLTYQIAFLMLFKDFFLSLIIFTVFQRPLKQAYSCFGIMGFKTYMPKLETTVGVVVFVLADFATPLYPLIKAQDTVEKEIFLG